MKLLAGRREVTKWDKEGHRFSNRTLQEAIQYFLKDMFEVEIEESGRQHSELTQIS